MWLELLWRTITPRFPRHLSPSSSPSNLEIRPSPTVVNHGGGRSLGPYNHEGAPVSYSTANYLPTVKATIRFTAPVIPCTDVRRHTFKKASNLVKAHLTEATRPLNSELQPILARNSSRQPIHPIARLRQSKGRWYTTHSTINAAIRRFISTGLCNSKDYSVYLNDLY